MTNNTYNGWTNYATWKAKLELIDSDYWTDESSNYSSISGLAEAMESHIDESVDQYPNSFVKDWCNSLLSEVNWFEIAENILSDIE